MIRDRFCPNCGTEVDEDARFCPTCGQTLAIDAGGEEIPAAPSWPATAGGQAAGPGDEAAERSSAGSQPVAADEPTRPDVSAADEPAPPALGAARPTAAPPPGATPPPAAPPSPAQPTGERGAPRGLPFTLPGTLGGWLIGAGSGFAALALLPRLGNLLNVLLFVALLAVTASVFLADRLPDVPRLRLLTLITVMIALGVALDRAAFTARGVETIFLITILVAAAGVVLVEFDRDRPVPPLGG